MANRKSSRAFQRPIDGMRTLPLSPPEDGSKTDFFSVFRNKIQFRSNKVCYRVSLCKNFHKQSCTAVNLLWNNKKYRTENVSFDLKYWLFGLNWPTPLWLSWRMLSVLPNDVVSKIQPGQLHSALFGRRHSTLQSHGLFALAKSLLTLGHSGAQSSVLSARVPECQKLTKAHQEMRYPNVTWRIILYGYLIYHWTTTHLYSKIFLK